MLIKDLIPNGIKEYIKLLKLKRKYIGRNIESHLIEGNVKLGLNVSISRGVEINEGVSIGECSYINRGSIIASGIIGKFCSVGYYCQIGLPEHPINYISTSPYTYGKKNIFKMHQLYDDYNSPPIIENDVWVGSQSVILQGVKIGNGAIIAAGAVVTKDVTPYTIVGGVPAKVIRSRFNDEEIEYLRTLNWWDNPCDKEKLLKDLLTSKEKWFSKIKIQ